MPKPRNKFIDFTIDNFKAFVLSITLAVFILSLYCGFLLIKYFSDDTEYLSPAYQLVNAIDQLPAGDFKSNLYTVMAAEYAKYSGELNNTMQVFVEEKLGEIKPNE